MWIKIQTSLSTIDLTVFDFLIEMLKSFVIGKEIIKKITVSLNICGLKEKAHSTLTFTIINSHTFGI